MYIVMKIRNIIIVFLLFLLTTNCAKKLNSTSELPPEALPFLKEHFPNQTIAIAKKDWEYGEKGFEVILSDGTEVEFWKDGTWREVDGRGKPIPTAFIAQSIVDYVAKNYPNEKITHIDYGHKDVDVDLTNRIDLEFSKEGLPLK